ncbi:MAG TPA: UDP-2,3-diacylglucosamine diphosphatase [Bacteroidetes bacterium]|nr:UDP-2,3-diacylglucosamine diphosphatase [Bacteroidota bacterium]
MKTGKNKRELEIVVISDVHLGTFGCKANELLAYLKSVSPKILILNGDIIDIWNFKKYYFPRSHLKIIKYITTLLMNGTQVYYITGNHDEMLRKFKNFELGKLKIINKLELDINGSKTWFFHGDVFDVTMKHSKWLAKLGGRGYDLLIIINRIVNWFSSILGYGKLSFSKKIKKSVKGIVSFINDFEQTIAEIAAMKNFDIVVCGHIHHPQIKTITLNNNKSIKYLNSGDWVENMSSLEYDGSEWKIYKYVNFDQFSTSTIPLNEEIERVDFKKKKLFDELLEELQIDISY